MLSKKALQNKIRLKDDFEFYAAHCLKIRTKQGDISPLLLNSAQKLIHKKLEDQLARRGKVRALILKGRQQGCSTYVEGRYYWKVSHRKGVKAFILTHVDDATKAIFEMAKRYHKHCPMHSKPSIKASNAIELAFDRLDSGYQVGTAGSRDVGRSLTLQYFHGSEVAFWPHAVDHIAGAMQAVPDDVGTEIILESTSSGPSGVFYEMCKDAINNVGPYELIFVPWYLQQEYRKHVKSFEMTSDEKAYAKKHSLSVEQIAWRREKIAELRSPDLFRREYPSTIKEAFETSTKGALWTRETINVSRVVKSPPLVRIVVGVDPAVTAKDKSDDTGIIVAGVDRSGSGYIIDDATIKADPLGWAMTVSAKYEQHKADVVVAEVNNGGDLVETNIRAVNPSINVKQVRASRGKLIRAEPIAALYMAGKIHHVGIFDQLESQLCNWTPGDKSPDRLDAMVWAMTELMLDNDPTTPTIGPVGMTRSNPWSI